MTLAEKERIIVDLFGNNLERAESFVCKAAIKARVNIVNDLYNDTTDILSNMLYEISKPDGILDTYNGSMPLKGWVLQCTISDIKNYITYRNRDKRRANYEAERLDSPIKGDDSCTLGDLVLSSFDITEEVTRFEMGDRGQSFIDSLKSELDKQIAWLLAYDYTRDEICNRLNIKRDRLNSHIRNMAKAK